MGEIMNEEMRALPLNLPRTTAMLASVPSRVDMTATTMAILKLYHADRSQSLRWKNFMYHWREKPGGGKVRNRAELNEMGTIMRMGRLRKIRIAPHTQ